MDEGPEYIQHIRNGDRGLAEIVYHRMRDRVKRCVKRCGKRKTECTIYIFDETQCLWTRIEKDMLMYPASIELERVLVGIRTYLRKKVEEACDNDNHQTAETITDEISMVERAIRRCRNGRGMTTIINLAAPMFQDDGIERVIDSIPFLIGVRNGVVDLRSNRVRARTRDDHILNVIDIDYDPAVVASVMRQLVWDHDIPTNKWQMFDGKDGAPLSMTVDLMRVIRARRTWAARTVQAAFRGWFVRKVYRFSPHNRLGRHIIARMFASEST